MARHTGIEFLGLRGKDKRASFPLTLGVRFSPSVAGFTTYGEFAISSVIGVGIRVEVFLQVGAMARGAH